LFIHQIFVEESYYKMKAALFIIFDINEYQRAYHASFNITKITELCIFVFNYSPSQII